MKTRLTLLLALFVLICSCTNQKKLAVQNPTGMERLDESVVFSRAQISSQVEISEGMLPFIFADGKVVPSQIDDLDGDGEWDEVIALFDFQPNESKEVTIKMVHENEYPVFDKRTNVRLGIKQEDNSYLEVDEYQALSCKDGFEVIAQGESVSWENDKIGFRNYFDCRNVKDLFGKLQPGLILDEIGTPGFGSYHDLNDWGMDVLHCGSSLGSGGIALLKNDSLYRLGSTDVYKYKKIVEGPVRSIFELQYSGWEVDGELLEAVERISIYPGKYWFESDVTVVNCPDGAEIVTGIVTSLFKGEPFEFSANGFKCIGTHGVQSLNNDELGMGVILPENEAGKVARTSNTNYFKLGYKTVVEKGFSNIISETYYISQEYNGDKPAKHYFFAVWGLDKDQWKTEEGFKKYISEEALKLSEKIVVN